MEINGLQYLMTESSRYLKNIQNCRQVSGNRHRFNLDMIVLLFAPQVFERARSFHQFTHHIISRLHDMFIANGFAMLIYIFCKKGNINQLSYGLLLSRNNLFQLLKRSRSTCNAAIAYERHRFVVPFNK